MSDEADLAWYSVRCVFALGRPPEAADQTYEERITLWRAGSMEQAVERAEAEARQYAAVVDDAPSTYLGLAQAYRLADALADGAEVFSLLRGSTLGPDDYLDALFDTGTERQGHLGDG